MPCRLLHALSISSFPKFVMLLFFRDSAMKSMKILQFGVLPDFPACRPNRGVSTTVTNRRATLGNIRQWRPAFQRKWALLAPTWGGRSKPARPARRPALSLHRHPSRIPQNFEACQRLFFALALFWRMLVAVYLWGNHGKEANSR
jgi:hypothetical protein